MTSLADEFVHALRMCDAERMTRLLAPDAVGWLNVSKRDRSVEEIIAALRVERTLVRTSTLDVRQQTTTEDGFVVQFVFAGTTRGGAQFHVPICIVAHVIDGRIARFEEYTDGGSVRPLSDEFLAATTRDSAVE